MSPLDASNKRILKSVKATLDHLDAVLEAKRNGALGDDILVYGAVGGGYNEEQVNKLNKLIVNNGEVCSREGNHK